MKTNSRTIKILVILALMICFIPAAVYAAGNVAYKGHADKIVFEPGSSQSPTDLFESMKNVMPGDSITEKIDVKNDSAEKKDIKIYLKSLGADDASKDFLSQLKLTVSVVDGKNVFDDGADKTAGLSDWTLLGTVASGSKATLDVTLSVPLSVGDEYQNAAGHLKWQFKVEEIDKDSKDPQKKSVVKKLFSSTGDNIPIGYFILAFVAAGCIIAAVARRKRKAE